MAQMAKILFIPVHNRNDVGPDTIHSSQRERRARWILIAAVMGGLGLFWAGATLSRREETAGIRALPAETRHTLYLRTLDELSTVCREEAAAVGELRDHCVAQAHFIIELPECGDACTRAIARVLPHAHR